MSKAESMLQNSPTKLDYSHKNIILFISLFLCLAIFVLYWQILNHEFVFDDIWYVSENQIVSKGLSFEGVRWAFMLTEKEASYFHPLSWLSHMMDVEFYGLKPSGHHLSNIILHCLNTLLLFGVLARLTRNIPASGIVALLFAVHPLNIETVAWVVERKNLLSTFFGLSTILAYGHYSVNPNLIRYLLVCLLFFLSLLAKPALVILPLILLLIDFWPLGRLQIGKSAMQKLVTLVVEKIPLFALSIASVLVVSASLRMHDNMATFSNVPILLRIANALVSPIKYIAKIIAPFEQSILYQYPDSVPVAYWAGSLLLLVLGSALFLMNLKNHPQNALGWFWFLVGLLPVSGLLQSGLWPAMADRFFYFPGVGVFIILGWMAVNFYNSAGMKMKVFFSFLGLMITLYFMTVSYYQIRTWQTPLTLFQQAIIHTPNHYVVNLNFANALVDNGRVREAVPYYEKAISLDPSSNKAHTNLASAFVKIRRYEDAIPHFKAALELMLKKDEDLRGKIHFALGDTYEKLNDLDGAASEYINATQAAPDFADAYNALGIVLAKQGRTKEALTVFERALMLRPDDQLYRQNLNLARSLLKKK